MAISRFNLGDSLRQDLDDGFTLLTPSYRLSASVLEAYGSTSNTHSWREPAVLAVDVWINEIWEALATRGLQPFVDLEILNSQLEQELWLEAIESSRDAHPLIDASAMAQVASRAFQDLRRWSPEDTDHNLENFSTLDDVQIFRTWQSHFQRRCAELGRLSLVEATRCLADSITPAIAKFIGPIALLNFYQTPPNYAQLFEAIEKDSPLSRHYTLDANLFQLAIPDILQRRNVTFSRREFNEERNEIEAAVAWALTLQSQDPNAHIGIISPTPMTLRPLIEKVLHQFSDQHSTLGITNKPHLINTSDSGHSLNDTAYARDALIALSLNYDEQSLSDFCRLLRSPFLLNLAEEQESRIRCERELRDRLKSRTSRYAITKVVGAKDKPYACPILHHAMLEARTLQRQTKNSQSPRKWGALFRSQLSLLGFASHSEKYMTPTIKAWESCMVAFETSSEYLGDITLTSALSILRRKVTEHRSPNIYRQQCALSLYSPSEAAGLNFTHLWLIGFDDQSWPPAPHPNPLIPQALQRELGIPGSHASAQYDAAKQDLLVVCASVEKTIMASHHSRGDETEYRVSKLISLFPIKAADAREGLDEKSNKHAGIDTYTDEFESIFDNIYTPLMATESISGGQGVITHQSQCPFQAFAKYRLHANPLEPFETGLNFRERGSLMHWALEALYRNIDSHDELQALADGGHSQLMERIEAAVEFAIAELSKKQPELMNGLFEQIEKERLKHLLRLFINRDLQRERFVTSKPERPFELKIRNLKLNLRVDRIDTLSDGSVALIDYKTGSKISAISALQQERPSEMQLPVYYAAVTRDTELEPSALAIAQIHVENTQYHALTRNSNFDKSIEPITGANLKADKQGGQRCAEADTASWNEMTERWSKLVDAFAEEFNDGECRVDPTPSATVCTHCKLHSICRIKELKLDTDDESNLEELA